MNKSRPAEPNPPRAAREEGAKRAKDATQPPATGANRGSPAAPVMKQFQKTKAESTGRS